MSHSRPSFPTSSSFAPRSVSDTPSQRSPLSQLVSRQEKISPTTEPRSTREISASLHVQLPPTSAAHPAASEALGEFARATGSPRARAVSDPEGQQDIRLREAEQPVPRSVGELANPFVSPLRQRKRQHEDDLDDDKDDDATRVPTSVAAHKKQSPQNKRRHVLDGFSFQGPSINSLQPPSPLFFSNSPRSRPSLPARYSSSEAAARMLSKTKSEEHQIKTVSLPRGTITTPSIAGALQMRASSDRSSIARSSSPDSSVKADNSISIISSIGVVELLEQDERPTMIIDLGEPGNYGAGPLRPAFTNAAMRSHPGLMELATGASDHIGSDSDEARSFLQFKSWLLSAVVNGESLNVCLPSFRFAGLSWACSTLRKRLRLISGSILESGASPGHRGLKAGLPPSAHSHQTNHSHEEPADYFSGVSSGLPTLPTLPGERDHTPPSSTSILPLSTSPPRHGGYDSLVSRTFDPTIDEYDEVSAPSFDWTKLPVTENMPAHIKFARSIDWGSTSLGPIEYWSADLRQMCNLIMGSPHPAAMYWGEEHVAIYNEAYIPLAGKKHPKLMGMSYKVAWSEIWDEVKDTFASARTTGEATMKDDDCLFLLRSDYLEETYFSWSIVPIVSHDGTVRGLYNPAFEKTRRKIAERRMLTLREIGERTATARDVSGFWQQALRALEMNEYDTPFVLLYSVTDDLDSEASSIHSASITGTMNCHLEGSLGVPQGHCAAPETIDLRQGTEGFVQVFREIIKTDKPVLLQAGSQDFPMELVEGLEKRGFGDPCRSVVVCPIHPTTGESILGFMVLGVNPRRPYDEDYSLFLQLLSRQLATSLASVVLFEEEIRRGQRAARLAALDRMELSEQLAARTQEAIDSETKFTRMAEFAPVGMFIANSDGRITFCNDTWYDISKISRDTPVDQWMDSIQDDDRPMVTDMWRDLTVGKQSTTLTFRFKTPWETSDGGFAERWVLFSAYSEKYPDGKLKSVFGSFTDISKQKWAEGFQKRKMEEAIELKRQQENFIDMTSHEMRNPLSAILQCADEITTTMSSFRAGEALAEARSLAGFDEKISNALEAAQTIALCAQHQKRIVDDVLTLSKLDSELLLVTPVDAQPLTVVQRALKMHEGEMSSNDIKLEFKVDESYKKLDIDWMRFDPSRVLQVLINLTTNAIKFTTTENKRTITVSIAASKVKPSELPDRVVDYFPSRRPSKGSPGPEWGNGEDLFIQFGVQDTGRGLTPEEKKLLFIRFSQASPRTHVQYGGSGLGLFISRQLTELQGGEIGVASEAGKGSTFAFYVRARKSRGPGKGDKTVSTLAQDAAVAQAAGGLTDSRQTGKLKATKSSKPLGTKYILLVEDNLVNQKVLQKQLKNLGCVVRVANHGGEALEQLRQSTWFNGDGQTGSGAERARLSVVLMDQEMPVMDGLTATRKIREMEQAGDLSGHIPVIAVTANARSEQIQTALNAGMDDVVSKPFRIPDLIPKIEELMEKYPEDGA